MLKSSHLPPRLHVVVSRYHQFSDVGTVLTCLAAAEFSPLLFEGWCCRLLQEDLQTHMDVSRKLYAAMSEKDGEIATFKALLKSALF